MNVIEIRNLTKYYGKNRGIEDVSLQVEEGEIYGFIGPNGAGKSTTIRLLLSLIYPNSGSATIFGKDIHKEGKEIRKDIGYLPSEVFYYDKMKVIDLLKYSASFYEGDHIERLHELAEIMELDLKKRIDDLSYGNKKKVGIVQGLLHRPKLIILDEPTSGLDPLMQQKFFNLIDEENKNGATVFFSSHILGEVQRLCHRVAIIKEGRIITVENIQTLLENNYKKVVVAGDGITLDVFKDMEGITNIHELNNRTNFLYRGDINEIVKKMGEYHLTDLRVEEPTLEEIFLHYYK
jgi:ABC-2 type transport system ATP-binding protein